MRSTAVIIACCRGRAGGERFFLIHDVIETVESRIDGLHHDRQDIAADHRNHQHALSHAVALLRAMQNCSISATSDRLLLPQSLLSDVWGIGPSTQQQIADSTPNLFIRQRARLLNIWTAGDVHHVFADVAEAYDREHGAPSAGSASAAGRIQSPKRILRCQA
ncbi:hypothetical protein JKP88DRAFT_240869 [Tribonema minus]|uniref:Uncharacterized protein n=1 Tax=Tribonema minus TaxID=303371 RepID=A0A835Z798_9STRA|nr:hypothetical protein JKP88DRAFT_240869 [Tribonema minus]